MRSDIIKKGFERAPHRSLMYATGVKKTDIDKPFIAVCNSYTNIVPGHCHLDKVGKLIRKEIEKAGGFAVSGTASVVIEKLKEWRDRPSWARKRRPPTR